MTATPVPAPNNGDWSTIVSQTPEGGFLMGNPNAKVKLVEYGSLTCPHCAEFEEKGGKALVDNYVKKGLVSFEFRNFVRDPYDITAALIARCGGPASFFGLTRAFYADQKDWIGKIQAADPAADAGAAEPAAAGAVQDHRRHGRLPRLRGAARRAQGQERGLPRRSGGGERAGADEQRRGVELSASRARRASSSTAKLVRQARHWDLLEPAIKAALAS